MERQQRHTRGAPLRPALNQLSIDLKGWARSGQERGMLNMNSLLRAHRGDEARLAAAAFLRDFPNALRRLEVERLSRTSETRDGARPAAAGAR